MSSLLNPLGSGPVKPLPVSTPASGHHDAQWYRRVATKASAEPDTLPEGRVSDDAAWSAVSLLTAGILLYGGVGWLLSLWFGHRALYIAAGAIFGVVLAMFMLFRRLGRRAPEPETLRYGRQVVPTEDVAPMPDREGQTSKETRP